MLLGAIGIGMALLNIVVLRRVARVRTDAVAALRADRGRLMTASFNTLSYIETVKATGAEQDAFARWAGFLAKVVSARQRLGVPTAILTVVPPLLATANTGLILLVGGLKVVAGGISIGVLVAFQGLLSSLTRPVTQLTNLGESPAGHHRRRDPAARRGAVPAGPGVHPAGHRELRTAAGRVPGIQPT